MKRFLGTLLLLQFMGKRKMDSELQRIKLDTETVYQTSKGSNYYFRYQVKGERKCVSLKTANQEEAIRKAKAFLPTIQSFNFAIMLLGVNGKVISEFEFDSHRIYIIPDQYKALTEQIRTQTMSCRRQVRFIYNVVSCLG